MRNHKQPMFAKRHYEAIARALHSNGMPVSGNSPESLKARAIMVALCAMFERDHPQFDRYRFMRACEHGI